MELSASSVVQDMAMGLSCPSMRIVDHLVAVCPSIHINTRSELTESDGSDSEGIDDGRDGRDGRTAGDLGGTVIVTAHQLATMVALIKMLGHDDAYKVSSNTARVSIFRVANDAVAHVNHYC